MERNSVGKGASFHGELAQRLIAAAEEDAEYVRQRSIADDMFYGNQELLEEGKTTFDEMFAVLKEHFGTSFECGRIFDFGETIIGMRSRRAFFL